MASGMLDGQPTVLLDTVNGIELLTAHPGGGWSNPRPVAGGLDFPQGEPAPANAQSAVIGPLGIAAVFSIQDKTYLAESADGRHFTTRPLSDIAGDGSWFSAGISMNADAVIVRLVPAPAPGSDPSNSPVPGPQRLLVGTVR
jgi:hypothetical protein